MFRSYCECCALVRNRWSIFLQATMIKSRNIPVLSVILLSGQGEKEAGKGATSQTSDLC